VTPASQARESAGLSLDEAAKRARVCSAYLRAVERRGGASFVLAMRLARLYSCSANVFLYTGRETPETKPRGWQQPAKRSDRLP